MISTKVFWNKCQGNNWCSLLNVNLEHAHFDNMEGVYIIWHGGVKPRTVRVGQGIIKDRLAKHRSDPKILGYQQDGLYVTWAQVVHYQRDGVERYLAEALKPLVGDNFPDVPPTEVNLPW
ncbi:MAG: hypothetical protein HY582_02815 [Candidatus Omnitrophica bacterium]|nr:hypothetical protein [Candidatus Omnitrophota bacterium]